MKQIMIIIIVGNIISASTLEVLSRGKTELNIEKNKNFKINIKHTKKEKTYRKVTIKNDGIDRSVQVEVVSNILKNGNTLDKLHSKLGLIIDFKDKNLNIEAFSIRYNLKLKHQMAIGYYIFENKSTHSDIDIVEDILTSKMKENILTIKPNWPLMMKQY